MFSFLSDGKRKTFITELQSTAQLTSVLSLTKSGLKSLARTENTAPLLGLEVTGKRGGERRLNLVQLYFMSEPPTINSGEEKTVLWS